MDLLKALAFLLWKLCLNIFNKLWPSVYRVYSHCARLLFVWNKCIKVTYGFMVDTFYNGNISQFVFNFIMDNGVVLSLVVMWICYRYVKPNLLDRQKRNQGQVSVEKQVTESKESQALQSLFDMVKVAYRPGVLEKIINILENSKIDVNCKQPNSRSGMTLFLSACLSGERKLLDFMLRHDISSQSAWGDSPLHLATFACANQTKSGAVGAVTILIQAGCDINCKNWHGNTPLSIAATYGKENLVRYLLFQGADLSIPNNDGIYPVDFATNAGFVNIAKLLALTVPNNHVWEVVDPHTPPHIQMGLQTPRKHHLAQSSFAQKRLRLHMFRTPVKRSLKPEE
ncbi:DNA-binding protein RFXANK isoform X2 [Nematostella vectensis]|uniref:DNA-binding protein RFXANK isoform X2 n=1 Tax=Nematostella vectensis TaxID=45351 RepID=UPI0020774C78|nr:DNA-binding protein RFXANK isoform X2 [Nematostella vectensis]